MDAGAGPGLIFVTLPNVFNSMIGGRLWGSLFFIFMTFAAMTTVVAVFENITAYSMESFKLSRKKAVKINVLLVTLLSIPCALGFSVFSKFAPLGAGSTVLDLEDFLVSNTLLPLGSLVYLFFCCSKKGWGWDNFIEEADAGNGIKFPRNRVFRIYVSYVIPVIVLAIFVMGYWEKIKLIFS